MLVGREQERAAIHDVVTSARVGQSAALLLTGEAGIGKTALLDDAVSTAAGMAVLRAHGTESEAEVPFGALLQLLRPALVHLDRIPAPQSQALSSALALSPGTGENRFAIGAATLSLLSRFAEDHPVVVVVDDAHLLDLPSAQAITFAARRLTADPIGVIATLREGQEGPFSDAGLPVLRIGGLTVDATVDLLARGGRQLGRRAVQRLHDVTGGNPLAVLELAGEAESLEPPPFGTPAPVPASVARAFARRTDGLSSDARTAVLVAATAGGDLAVVTMACKRLGADVARLDEAEDAGLLRVAAGQVVFRHPLVRSAVYSDATPGRLREVHRAVVAALPAHDSDRRAWHLGRAALGPDEEVASALDEVGRTAGRRGAHAVAAGAFERSAQLSPGAVDRARRFVVAGESAWQAGMADRAVALLDQASRLEPPPHLRTRVAAARGAIAARTGSVQEARDLLLAAGAESTDVDPDAAVMLLGDAILSCFFLGDTATVQRAADLIDATVRRAGSERARLVADIAGGVAAVLVGRGGPERIRRALENVSPTAVLTDDLRVAPWLVLGPLFLREKDTGRDLVRAVVERLRQRTVLVGLPFLLFHVGRDQATTDHWDVAETTYAEGIQLAREAGQSTDLTACLSGLAWLEARQGRETVCREHAAEVQLLSGSRHIALFECWTLFALGELDLGLGRPESAIASFERLDARLVELGIADVDLSPVPELVEALARVGREAEGRDAAARFAVRADAKGQPWASARAARATAMTGPDAAIDESFGRALALHALTPDSFELARTQLSHGSRLRRARRRVEARPPLRAALETFEALGAAPWADQAAVELRASGETVQRRGADLLKALTPQELQVARMLAEGRTTKEAAAALFLSPKTVEYHLRHVYVKLSVRSRTELAAALRSRT